MSDKSICEVCGRTYKDVKIAFCSSAGKYLCSKHRNQWLRHGEYKPDEKQIRVCEVCGKTNEETTVYYCAAASKMLCVKHKAQYLKYGYFLGKTRRDPNEYILHDDYAEIVLDNKKEDGTYTAKIDIEDIEKCQKYHWYVTEMMGNSRYVKAIINGVNTGLHRYVLDYHGENVVDHINRNGLDNRKQNLRIVTNSENCVNSKTRSATGEKNIYNKNGRYQVQIIRNYRNVYIKTFDTIEEAIVARDSFVQSYNTLNNREV